jgi:two-component system, OmpR family, sensor histidine kinase ChvG
MPSIRSTAQDTDSPKAADKPGLSGGMTLRQRILAVNIFAVILLAASFFYLDSYRKRLVDERMSLATRSATIVGDALAPMDLEQQQAFVARTGQRTETRYRLANAQGAIIADSWAGTGAQFTIRNPANEPWQRHVARWMDDAIEFVADAGDPPKYAGFKPPADWPASGAGWTLARDRTHVIWAIRPVGNGLRLMAETNARDIRRLVRAERERLGAIIALVSLLSVLLSLFLARTIEQPLRALSEAALRVRYGRDREVIIPRLPTRRDEIGLLARALSDMTHALRQRIDATEAFAADVAHELKNPLASLSSAAQSLRTVKQPELRDKLEAIIAHDVVRLDRLITDISELSRLDARLARVRFQRIDFGKLISEHLAERKLRDQNDGITLAFAKPLDGAAIVMGDAAQLERVIANLIGNAASFSPEGGLVQIAATRDDSMVQIAIEDEGPGIPEEARESVFERFHTDRPDDAGGFGEHSGLGLAIARTIIEGHGGTIAATERGNQRRGARLVVRLPAADAPA